MNMKKLFIFTLVFAVCCFMTTSSWAAKKTDFYKSNAKDFIRSLNDNGNMGKAFGLSNDEDFIMISQRTDLNGETHTRYQQTLNGFPVWGIRTILSTKSGKVLKLHGAVVKDAPKDVGSIPKNLNALGALRDMQEVHRAQDVGAEWNFRNETYGTYVYFHKKSKKARLCYVVSFFADTECGNPSQMIFFIDAKNNKIIDSYDMLRYAYDGTGPGGNQKVGQYYYGTDFSKFGVAVNGSTCTMNYADCKSVNLNHGTSGTTPYSYTCYENTFKEINGAYSPINDAQFFGQQIYNMYQDWYGLPVLPFQLMMRVHYSTNYENAFWDGSSMTFGDGYTTFYPLVCLDVSAHEVAHGFTQNHSNLTYSGQSGGINESYSDMAGEAAKYYMRGTNDFMCGYDIFKSPSGALRYLYDPPLDGQSIDHVDDYYSGMDVHYSSGVFNKAFYLIAVSPGWTTRMSFDVFTKANTDYWGASTNFVQGAEGAQDAAADLGYSCSDVRDAFNTVGITLVCAGPPVANFSGTPTSGGAPLNVNFTDLSSNDPTSWSWSFPGGTPSGSTAQNPSVTYNTPGNYNVTLTAANASGSDPETKTNYIAVTAPQPPVANFTASTTSPPVGGSVTFTDTSTNTPTSWSWTFEGGTPGSSTAQNPTITYNTEGTYDVTLTATNAQGSDPETKVNYINVSAIPYCASQGTTYNEEWIAGVEVGTMNNTSGSSGYTDFTGITCELTADSTVNVVLTPDFNGGPWTEYWKIWIDYNGDHDFEDSGEEVFSGSGTSTVTGSFTVGSVTTTTRMRVTMKYNAAPTPCETFSYGEVEDYTANITGACTQYTLTTNTVGNGSISLNPPGGTYCEGTVVTLTATPDAGWKFDAWSGDLSGTTSPADITMNSNKSVTATFSLIPVEYYNLTVTTVGQGSVTLDPSGGTYPDGTIVTLTAVPDSEWKFDNWSGDLTGSANPTTITMDADKTVTATFSEDPVGPCTEIVGHDTVFSLSTTTASRRAMPFIMPENGEICSVTMYHNGGSGNMIMGVYDGESLPANRLGVTASTAVSGSTGWQTIDLTSPAFVASGAKIWLAWVYESNPGMYYESGSPGRASSSQTWSGGMPDPFGSSTTANYIYSIYANYTLADLPQYTLIHDEVGNGTVTLNPPGGIYDAGTVVTLTATPDSGWLFSSWSGDLSGSTNPTTITMNSNKNVTATFIEEGTTGTVGNETAFGSTSTSGNRRAMPFTMPEDGTITSVTMYHSAGSGSMILGVYDGASTPQNRLGVTATTALSGSTWQTINLTGSAFVAGGSTVWLAWVYESNPGIRYQTGSPGRYQSTATWSGGMPDPFGSGSQTTYIYSIYATYNK